MNWENGQKYVGEYLNDKKHGKGKMIFDNKDEFDCYWKNDIPNG